MPLDKPNFVPGLEPKESTPAVAPELPPDCCARCIFCTIPPPEAKMLPICRRYPPQPFIAKFYWNADETQTLGNSQVAVFPFVVPQGWCGEFKRNPEGVQ